MVIVILLYLFSQSSSKRVSADPDEPVLNRPLVRTMAAAPSVEHNLVDIDINSLPPSLWRHYPNRTKSPIRHPMNHNMAFQQPQSRQQQRQQQRQQPHDSWLSDDVVAARYRELARGYLRPFRGGIHRSNYIKILKRWSYSAAPPGANRGLQALLFQVVKKRLYMCDPHGVAGGSTRDNGKSKPFYRGRLNEVLWILRKLVKDGRISNTEFVVSIHDCVQTVRNSNPYRTARYLESAPVFTVVACNFSDNIPMPVWEGEERRGGHLRDWDRQMAAYAEDNIAWRDKIGQAVFRGGNRQSMFFRRSEDAHKHCDDLGRSKLYNVGQKNPTLFNVSLSGSCDEQQYTLERLSARGHHRFRYVVYMEGNCMWADRLKQLVFGPSAIIKQETACGQFFEPLLRPFVHYLPTDYFLDDVVDIVEWATKNEDAVRTVVYNAKRFAANFLSLAAIETYVETLLDEYNKLRTNLTVVVEKDAYDVTDGFPSNERMRHLSSKEAVMGMNHE